MKQSAIRSHFKLPEEDILLLILPAYLLLYADRFRLIILLLGICFYGQCTKFQKMVVPVLILICFYLYPEPSSDFIHEGRVIDVRRSYAVVRSNHVSVLVYTDAQPAFDSVIWFDGESEPIEASKGFFRFPFADYCRKKGIRYSVRPDTIRELRPTWSMRGRLMNHIRSHHTEKDQALLLDVLFHISHDDGFSGLFRDRGISLAGVIAFAAIPLNYLCFPDQRKKVLAVIILLLALFYHFPFLAVYRLLRIVLEKTGMKGKQVTGTALLIALRIYPYAIYSPAFLLPYLFAFAKPSGNTEFERMFLGMHASSLLFHSVNPIEYMAFRLLLPLSGFLWVLALSAAIVPLPFAGLIRCIDQLGTVIQKSELPGTLLGFGLPFYIILQLWMPKQLRKMTPRILLFLVFQYSGLFHPLAELTFLNVGQGDSILIRGPFRTGDILIDTGKPGQKNNLFSFLDAKGIHTLDVLVITHPDTDHSGNQEAVIESYRPSRVFTEHPAEFTAGRITCYDLNEIRNEDENESSIVTYLNLNHMQVLLMADSDHTTEETLIHRYPSLHADILKLSHHGSSTGSSESFLNTVRPFLAIVSSGAYKIYHHPSPEVTERLYRKRIPYLDTKEEGDISIFCFPGFNLLLTSRGKIAIIRV